MLKAIAEWFSLSPGTIMEEKADEETQKKLQPFLSSTIVVLDLPSRKLGGDILISEGNKKQAGHYSGRLFVHTFVKDQLVTSDNLPLRIAFTTSMGEARNTLTVKFRGSTPKEIGDFIEYEFSYRSKLTSGINQYRFIPYHVRVYLGKAFITLFDVALFSKFPTCYTYKKGYYQQLEEMSNGKEVTLDNWARIVAENNAGNSPNLLEWLQGDPWFSLFSTLNDEDATFWTSNLKMVYPKINWEKICKLCTSEKEQTQVQGNALTRVCGELSFLCTLHGKEGLDSEVIGAMCSRLFVKLEGSASTSETK